MSDRLKFGIAVHVLLINRENKILLLRRVNTGYRDGHFTDPAGHLDGDNHASKEAARECLEETGINVAPEDLSLVHVVHGLASPSSQEYIHLFFQSSEWQGEAKNVEPHKAADMGWYPLNDLPSPLLPEVAAALLGIRNNHPYSEI